MRFSRTTRHLIGLLAAGALQTGLSLPCLAQCPEGNEGTALWVNFYAYTTVIGGAISGEDVYRTAVSENCGGICPDGYDYCSPEEGTMTLAGTGTYPIPASMITSNGNYTFTIPANTGEVAFRVPLNNTNIADHDRTGTLTINSTYSPTGGGQYTSATVTLLNTNSIVSVLIPGYGTNWSSSNLLACGVNGSSNCVVRFYRNTAYEARTIYYTVSGSYQGSNYSASPSLSGTAVISNGLTNVDISISATNWAQKATNTITITLSNGLSLYQVNSAAKTVTVTLVPDYPTIGMYASSAEATRGETTSSLVFYKATPYYANSGARKISFSTSGSAVNGTDYTLASASPVTIAAGSGAATNTLTPKTKSSLGGTETMTGTISANTGMYAISSTNNTATVGILEDAPLISVSASSADAYQNGAPGAFTLTRQDGLPFSLAVNYTLTGTAANGTDYTTLPTSVTFAANQTSTNLTVTPVLSPLLSGAKTAVLSLSTGSLYYMGATTQAVVTLLPQSSFTNSVTSPVGRYWRGTGSDPTFWSSVIPLDSEKGIVYSNVNGNCSTLYPGLTSWSTSNLYHYNATNTLTQTNSTNRIQFNNPIVAFGERVGGTPLYLNQNYSFGIYAGDQEGLPIAINVYARSNYAYVGAISLTIPATSNLWLAFASNGFQATFTNYGLVTTMSTTPDLDWGATEIHQSSYVLTHQASAAATNYYYVVESYGWPDDFLTPMAQGINGSNGPSLLYSLEFESYPPWRSVYIDQPHFDGSPLPPFYAGMTVAEMLTNTPPVTNSVSLAPSACTNIDDSPELREHPILDQFVASMGNDPIALANYVINQIDLTDAMDYNDDGNVAEQSINLGGMTRGALGTFLEKQGSPLEQCALLVYLLRKAGVPAAYEFPPHNGMQILDARLSRMLKFQVQGGFSEAGQLYTSNTMIAVNYPWVAAYIGTNWIHIFPWLKDYDLEEGLNLWDYMPANYPNAYAWVHDYIYSNTNLLSLAVDGDNTPRVVFPAYLKQTLLQNHPTVSTSDIGMKVLNRQHYYAQWSAFPTPTWLTNTSYTVESMSASSITNVDSLMTNVFDTLSVEVYSLTDPHKDIQTGPMRLVDLHNRQFYLTQTNSATNQWPLSLILAPFRTNVTTQYAYTNDSALLSKEVLTTTLDQFDDQLNVRFRYYRHRALSPSYAIDPTLPFLGFGAFQQIVLERPMRKGDLAAICLDYGRVTRDMLNVHAQDLWQMENTLRGNSNLSGTISSDVYQGATMYLAGMSYYEKQSEFDVTNSCLHKINNITTWAAGLSKLSPHRNSSGGLYNGGVDPILPNVDMFFYLVASVGNGTLDPDSGQTKETAFQNYALLSIVDCSAQEHQVINTFYGQTNAVSTVRLLQLAQNRGQGIVPLNYYNYAAQATTIYQGHQLQSFDTSLWQNVSGAFQSAYGPYVTGYITPGPITNASYSGMGAFVFEQNDWMALISPSSLNGGFGENMPDGTIAPNNTVNYNLDMGDSPVLNLQPPPTDADLPPDEVATFNAPQTYNQILNNTYTLDPVNTLFENYVNSLLGLPTLGTPDQTVAQDFQTTEDTGLLGNTSDAGAQVGTRMADPVNTITGEFYVDETDLQLAGPIPLALRRNYSSQNLADNQFGTGWKLSIMPYLSVGAGATNIYAADMDGAVLAYVQVSTNTWTPTLAANPQLNNNTTAGVGGLVNRLRDRLIQTVNAGVTNYTLYGADGSVRTFFTTNFNDGVFSQVRPYLQEWTDNVGNYYTFTYGTDPTQPNFGQVIRIQCSNGNYLGFDYDVYGHILDAYCGDGRWLYYYYNEYGDLTSVTLPDGTIRQYQYLLGTQTVTNGSVVSQQPYSTHLLIEEDKPEGRVLQNAYDSQQRVTNQLSTAGTDLNPVRTATFIYSNNFNITNSPTNSITGTTWIVDGLNNTNRYDYTNSLIILMTDPLGQTIQQIWYPDNATTPGYPRSVSQRKDKRGLWSQFLYDPNGNVTNTVITGDITGDGIANQTATNTAVYNTNSLPLQETDAVGNSLVFVYDLTYLFLPQQVIHYAGTAPVSTNFQFYAAATNVVTLGSVTQTNIAFGLLTRQIRAYGSPDAATNDWAYNGEGFITQTIRYSGTSDPNVANTYFTDERGEIADVTNAVGAVKEFEYDAMGRKISEEDFDQYGNVLSWNFIYYNDNGEVEWIDGPRYNPEDYIFYDHDGAGRVTNEIHWRSEAQASGGGVETPSGYNVYAQTFAQYDVNGNLLLKVDPRGAITTNRYDPLNRLAQQQSIDLDGVTILSSQGFAYEPGGQVAYATNALGGWTYTGYATTGQPEYQIGPDGATNGWRYYLDGRIHRRYISNGSYWETTYNDAALLATNIFYAVGGIPQATNIIGFDRRRNKTLRIDELGNAFTNIFDGLNRLKYAAGPAFVTLPNTNVPSPGGGGTTSILQQALTNYYDAAGLAVTNINAVGEMHITYFDLLGRPIDEEIHNATSSIVRQATATYSADHQSVTIIQGSGATAITNKVYTDIAGNPVLTISYPSSGVQEFALRTYDLSENLISETRNASSNGVVTQWTSVANTFDGLNRRVSKTDRDGALTSYAYDLASHCTNMVMPGGLIWRAAFNRALQMQFDCDLGSGGSVTRSNSYTYNAVTGLLQTKTDGRGVTCTHYFDAFLRPATNVYSGPLPEHKMTTVFSYDPRNSVTNVSESFASTNTGPGIALARSYDAYRELISDAPSGGAAYTASQSWDSAGRRTGLGIANFGWGYSWQADGMLLSVNGPTGYGGGAYTYDTAGHLLTRTFSPRVTSITQRDGDGRPTSAYTKVNGSTILTETLSFTGDGLLSTHTLVRPDFTDYRSYSYANQSRRLTQEIVGLSASASWTNAFVYDYGTTGGPGVLTSNGQAAGTNVVWKAGTDAFSRINSATNSVAQRQAYGRLNGTATMTALLDGNPMPVTLVGTNDAYEWQAQLALQPGAHKLVVNALNWSGFYTASATNTFTNNAADRVQSTYAGNGEVTNRVWINSIGQTNATQSLSWDAKDRLHGVTYLDSNTNGYSWSAIYDPLGRRLSTTTIFITNGVTVSNLPRTISQYFDPNVRFLDMAESDSGVTTWKFYGPDVNGVYGGMHGVGGLEAVVNAPRQASPVISDLRGNGLALYNLAQASVVWFASRPTAYGGVPGYRPLPLTDGSKMAPASAWRHKWPDITGLYYMGYRYVDPIDGNWLSADPLGHTDFDPTMNTVCGGDPVNYFDPDGRCAESSTSSSIPGAENYPDWLQSMIQAQGRLPDSSGHWSGLGDVYHWSTTVPLTSFAVANTDSGWGGQGFLDAAFNVSAIQQDWSYVSHPDFSSGWGVAIWGTSVLGLGANAIGAVGNVLTVGELGAVKTGIQKGLTELTETGVKTLTEVADTGALRVGSYGDLAEELQGSGLQANHLNQNAAFRSIIPPDEGLAVGMEGNAITEPGTAHYDFHQSLEQFWDQYRPGGELFGQVPSNGEYGQALQNALEAGGLTSQEAAELADQAAAQRAASGLSESSPVPRIPGRINQTQP
jgi:RHS repeat-associated protein